MQVRVVIAESIDNKERVFRYAESPATELQHAQPAEDMTGPGVVQVHTPAMDVDPDFSWSQFLWMVFIFVGVPTMIGVGVIWSALRRAGRNASHSGQ